MQVCSNRLTHLGLKYTPRRSTLSDANRRRTGDLFQDLYHQLYHHYYGSLPDSLKAKKVLDRLFIIDSSIITLFTNVLQGTGCADRNGQRKGGIKAHMMVQAKNDAPCFVRLTAAKQGDATFLPLLQLPAGSIVVMDKGYRNFGQFIKWTKEKVTWVTRLHERTAYRLIEQKRVTDKDQIAGVLEDCIIEMGSLDLKHINPIQTCRLISFYDPQNDRTFQFITNSFKLSAGCIADIYKKRWQIELMFKRIKQNFQLRLFLGDNENAIRIQLWCALIADLLLKIVKDKIDKRRRWSMANLAGFIRLHLNTYIHLNRFLSNPEKALLNYQTHPPDQFSLFETSIRGA